MKEYRVEIEHRETDQVFSYYHGDGMLHFNATLLARLHKAMPHEFARVTVDLNEEQYNLCMVHRGIEEDKVAALRPKDLREPGYAVMLDERGLFTIIDGHHRLVRRYRGGVRVMDFWMTDRHIWQHCLVQYEAGHEELLARGMPPRVDDPMSIMSSVRLHPRKSK